MKAHSCHGVTAYMFAALFVAAMHSVTAITLVRDGKPFACISLPAKPQPCEDLAAEELNAYLQKMSGTVLPIVRGDSPKQSALAMVMIGLGSAAPESRIPLKPLPFGGFVIRSTGDRLVLSGSDSDGVLNSVYGLLEDTLGVRWFMPTDLGENVPHLPTVVIPDMDRTVTPRFINRRNHGVDSSVPGAGKIWKRRIRITSHDLGVPFNRYSHNLYRIIRPSLYGKTHPEYFPMLNGERFIPPDDRYQSWQPCTTNPDVVRLTVEAATEHFEKHPEANCFSVGMNDGRGFCECEQCTALDIPGKTFRKRPMVSERYFSYVADVARRLLKTHPDKYVTCIAYSVVEAPPENVELPPNVGVVITQDVGQWHDPQYKQEDMDFAGAWASKAGAFGTYNYTSLGWLLPRVYPHMMADSLRFYDEVGAVAVTNESWPSFWYAGPMFYVRAKMMWDPTLDPDAILAEYYDGFFGPAAQPMKTFYERLETVMLKERPGKWFEGLSSVPAQIALWSKDDVDSCRTALAAATRQVTAEGIHRQRLELVTRGFGWIEAILEEYWQAQNIRDGAARRTADATPLAGLRTLIHWKKCREERWEDICNEPLIAGNYMRIIHDRPQRLSSWQSFVSQSIAVGIAALIDAEKSVSREELRQLAASLEDDELRSQLGILLWVMDHPDAENLVVNPGCDSVKPAAQHSEGQGWVNDACPPGWSKWAINPANRSKMTWETKGGRTSAACMRLGSIRNACFIQTHPSEPGKRYYASAWTRAKTAGNAPTSGLYIQWKDADGKWVQIPRRQADITLTDSEWHRLSVVFTVPDSVARIVVLCRAQDVPTEQAVYFDDIRLINIPATAEN